MYRYSRLCLANLIKIGSLSAPYRSMRSGSKDLILIRLVSCLLHQVPVDSIVMFSPSGVPVLTRSLKKFPQLSVNSVKVGVKGP